MSSLRNIRRTSGESQPKMAMEPVENQANDKEQGEDPPVLDCLKDDSNHNSKEQEKNEDNEHWMESLSEYSDQVMEVAKTWTCKIPAQYIRSFALEWDTKKDE